MWPHIHTYLYPPLPRRRSEQQHERLRGEISVHVHVKQGKTNHLKHSTCRNVGMSEEERASTTKE